jgi:hypothetical protein
LVGQELLRYQRDFRTKKYEQNRLEAFSDDAIAIMVLELKRTAKRPFFSSITTRMRYLISARVKDFAGRDFPLLDRMRHGQVLVINGMLRPWIFSSKENDG